jgi:hypothetical protein
MVVYSNNAQALIDRNAIVKYVPHKQTITLKQTTNHQQMQGNIVGKRE